MALSSADSEGRAYRNASPGLRFFLTAGLALALMFLDHRGIYLAQVRAYLGAAIYPLQIAINSPSAGLGWVRENLVLRETLQGENAALRSQALTNRAELQRLAALQAENARLRGLLDSKARVPNRVVVAEILAVDMDPLRHRVVLNKGGREGASEGQALIDALGVVGQITRDQGDSAEAILITDPDHAVPVEIVRNGLRTIAVGTGDLERLSLPFLTRNADIKAGDLLITSGLGGTFPPGYPVGTVTGVDGSSGDAFLEIAAQPAANLDRLHEVLLVFLQQGSPAKPGVTPAPVVTPVQPSAPATPAPAPAPGGEPAPVVASPPVEAAAPAPRIETPTVANPTPNADTAAEAIVEPAPAPVTVTVPEPQEAQE